MTSAKIFQHIEVVRKEIAAVCKKTRRTVDDITLIAVSKTRPVADLEAAHAAGLVHFGENYLQEAEAKIAELRHLPIVWHYIGSIQSNKTQAIASNFDWVHTVDRNKIGQRLNDQCPPQKQLNVLLQVNSDDDPNKGGVPLADCAALTNFLCGLPNLRIRGLMTILAKDTDPAVGYDLVQSQFAAIKKLLADDFPDRLADWDTLSMGMSGDFATAIAYGSTQIRIGTALFGPRSD